jgi:4-hydroxy-tetrahydrodipicolinate synthase
MSTPAPFGRMLTAMVTPFKKDGSIDWDGVEKIADHLVKTGHDGIVVNGTTGEAPTTKSSEKEEIIKVVKRVVGANIKVVSGAGDNETDYSINQAKRSEAAGADGILVVTPYYNKPPQAGIKAHFLAMANATGLPMMLYDIPGRTGVEIESDTIVELFEHPSIVALKDAKGNVAATSWVIKRCGIPVYSGDDILNLPLLSVGAVGFVSVCGHTVGAKRNAQCLVCRKSCPCTRNSSAITSSTYWNIPHTRCHHDKSRTDINGSTWWIYPSSSSRCNRCASCAVA